MSGRPNLLGRFVVGYDPSNQDYNTIGNMGGEALVTLTLDQIPPHSHKITFKEENGGTMLIRDHSLIILGLTQVIQQILK